MSEDDTYEVGYKKPPKRTRFKPGQSGNPSGRPKWSKSKKEFAPLDTGNFYEFQKQIVDAGYEEIHVIKDGQPHKMSKVDALLAQLYTKAMKGDNTAAKILLKHTRDSLKDLGEAGHRVYRTTIQMRESERKNIFTPSPSPGTHGEFLERLHLTFSVRFAYRELYGKEKTDAIGPEEPETENDWAAFNHKMKKQYQEMGDEPVGIEIQEIPSMFKL